MKKLSLATLLLSVFLLSGCGKEVDSPQSFGSEDAAVQIEEFSDVQCPACGVISPLVDKIARKYPDQVRLTFYHFPLTYHEYAFMGAEAAECAGDQGVFWEYLNQTYQNQKQITQDFFADLAKSLKLDESAFKTCMSNHDKKSKIQAHIKEGMARQIPGTPTLYVNGQMVKWSSESQFEAYLKSLMN